MVRMRLVTVVRIIKDGVTGESALGGKVSEGYSEEQFARRMIKQFRDAKQEWTAGASAKRAVDAMQIPMFEIA
jgi:hypothetical protein